MCNVSLSYVRQNFRPIFKNHSNKLRVPGRVHDNKERNPKNTLHILHKSTGAENVWASKFTPGAFLNLHESTGFLSLIRCNRNGKKNAPESSRRDGENKLTLEKSAS